jgi:quercetin dioxygenase-like cupin family protein
MKKLTTLMGVAAVFHLRPQRYGETLGYEREVARMVQKNLSMLGLVAVVTLGGIASADAESMFDPRKTVAVPAESVVYEQVGEGVQLATPWGDRAHGPHGTFGTFVPGFENPFHTHTFAYHGIVIEGVLTNAFEGEENPPELGPGSYWYVPAGAPHANSCVSDTPCRWFLTQDGPFDFFVYEEK